MGFRPNVPGSTRTVRRRIAPPSIVLVVMVGWALTGTTAGAMEAPVVLPADDPPAAIAGLGNLDIATALALSYDGRVAALGSPDPIKPKGGLVRIYNVETAAVTDVSIKGHVVALSFDRWGETLFALGHRMGKKGPLDAFVDRIDLAAMKAVRLVTLPASASDMDLWIHGSSLLISCEDE
ncbi:MAG: hypothetical protein R3344_03260, partial [Acidobacteriota bacterium]|nr:hypothetical protein [Acidobacteriota bacterium]